MDFCTLDAIALADALADFAEDPPELETPIPFKSPEQAKHLAAPPPCEIQTPSFDPPKPSKNQKKNAKDRGARRALRELRGSGPKECALKYRTVARRNPLESDASLASDLPHSKPAWVGLRESLGDRNVYGLKELQEQYGLRLFEWDGRSASLKPQQEP